MMRAMGARVAYRRHAPRRRGGRSFVAVSLCLAGLVLAAAFVGITAQGNALAREIAETRAEIASGLADKAAWQALIAEQQTPDYVTQKARDFGFVGPNEELIGVQRGEQPSASSEKVVPALVARVARWISFFFGTRES
jgi:septum formation initiator